MRYLFLALMALGLMSTPAHADEPTQSETSLEVSKALVVGASPMLTTDGYGASYLWAGPMWYFEPSPKFWLAFNPYAKLSPDTGYWGVGLTTTFEWMVTDTLGMDLLFEVSQEQVRGEFSQMGVGVGSGPGFTWYATDDFFLSGYCVAFWDLRYQSGSINPGLAMGLVL